MADDTQNTEEQPQTSPAEAPAVEPLDVAVDDGGPLDLDKRVLCSDGNCIGVVGTDGRCKECGAAYDGELPAADEPAAEAPEPAEEDRADEPAAEPAEAAEQPAETPVAPTPRPPKSNDWNDRLLCSDGSCIGVIGPDGRCKECGKPYEGEPE